MTSKVSTKEKRVSLQTPHIPQCPREVRTVRTVRMIFPKIDHTHVHRGKSGQTVRIMRIVRTLDF